MASHWLEVGGQWVSDDHHVVVLSCLWTVLHLQACFHHQMNQLLAIFKQSCISVHPNIFMSHL